ncbi:MAG: hypothetical protein Q8R05_04285 [Candidatus Omnitrophota bacterium]|nr:hypothetical protein [Candidatus Omnitrophota bacterium]
MAEDVVKVKLEVEPHAYKKIAFIIRDHKNMLFNLKVNELIKKNLARDMDIIRRILESSEVKDGGSGKVQSS